MSLGYSDNFAVDDIIRFVQEYPQGSRDDPNYFFIGGCAVMLHQEFNNNLQDSSEKRPVSDLDIMSYFSHLLVDAFNIAHDLSFDWSSGVPETMISSLYCKNQQILLASPTLTIGSKMVMTDAPRRKDYEDYLRLESLIDADELFEVFKRATYVNDSQTALLLYGKMASSEGRVQENYFRCLRDAANVISKHPEARAAVDYCLQDEAMDSTMINRVVLYNMNKLLDETVFSSYSSQIAMEYAQYCRGQDAIELDRTLAKCLLPTAKKRLEQLQSKNH